MSETNPSLVSSELTTIETFKDTTEKRRSTLTLNELNYISDKQLHQKTDGEGGGSDLWPGVPIVIKYTDTEVPYEDVPDWAKIDSTSSYRRVNVLKVEDPFQIPMNAYAVVSYTEDDNYYGENEQNGNIHEAVEYPVLFWADSSAHSIVVNTQTKEAFEISGGK